MTRVRRVVYAMINGLLYANPIYLIMTAMLSTVAVIALLPGIPAIWWNLLVYWLS